MGSDPRAIENINLMLPSALQSSVIEGSQQLLSTIINANDKKD